MNDLIYKQDAMNEISRFVGYLDNDMILRLRVAINRLPAVKQKSDGAWEMFELITSAFYGKQYYFLEDCGLVYSRASAKHMSMDDAVSEFVNMIGWDGE